MLFSANRIRAMLSAAVCLLLVAPALADELELTNGTVYKGVKLGEDSLGVKFQVQMDGGGAVEMVIPRNEIKAYRPGPAAGSGTPAAADKPAWQTGKSDTKTREQVEQAIAEAGKIPPAWLAGTKLDYPQTLDLTWKEANDADKDLAKYMTDAIYTQPDKWHGGLKLLHHVLELSKTPQAKARTAAALGEAYLYLTADAARAAWWYRQAGKGFECELAECYRKLGCLSLAGQTLALMPAGAAKPLAIRTWAQIGDLDAGLKLVDAVSRDGKADEANLAAGDACRWAGQYRRAVGYYEKAAAAVNADEAYKQVATASAEVMRKLDGLDLRRAPDGTYSGKTPGYAGDVTIEVTLAAGKIQSVKLGEQTEDRALTALETVPPAVAAAQGVKGVDSVTGATISSDAVLNAAALALASSIAPKVAPTPSAPPSPRPVAPQPEPSPKPDAPKGKYTDGVYTGEGRGHKSQIVLKITVRDGRIRVVEVVSQADDKKWWDRAKMLIPNIIRNNGPEGVNTVARATRSSRGILTAARAAMDKAKAN